MTKFVYDQGNRKVLIVSERGGFAWGTNICNAVEFDTVPLEYADHLNYDYPDTLHEQQEAAKKFGLTFNPWFLPASIRRSRFNVA